MLMEVKNHIKISFLSIKYALQREMLNKASFISNIVFMILNNSAFIIQWLIIYSIKDDIAGYSFKDIMLLWGIAALTYGISRFFFKDAFELSDMINKGKIDNYLLSPKNVLISCITSSIEVSAIGDMIYAYIIIILIAPTKILLYTFLGILGGLTLASVAVIIGSLAFRFGKSENFANTINSIMTNFATYPGSIFKGIIRLLFYTIIPLEITSYMPVEILTEFDIIKLLYILIGTIIFITIAFITFNKGLKRYSSTNLMNARI